MKLVADIDIPFLKGVFDNYFSDIIYKKGDKISKDDIASADALIVRTRTVLNKSVLEGSKVRAIATATIGTDHIDLHFCSHNSIAVYSSQGCNSLGVVQWILSAMYYLANLKSESLDSKVLGIVGVGNIGSKLYSAVKALGMEVLLCDPPRQRNEGCDSFVELKTIANNCDIISFNVPLILSGVDATYHLANNLFFDGVKPQSWLLNSSRGGVVDEFALNKSIESKKIGVALDVFENEPYLNAALIANLAIATPHIAGYTLEGKVNASVTTVRAISKHFGLGIDNWFPVPNPIESKHQVDVSLFIENNVINFSSLFQSLYPISVDSLALMNNPDGFEAFRNGYSYRRDFSGYNLQGVTKYEDRRILQTLGFNVSNQ